MPPRPPPLPEDVLLAGLDVEALPDEWGIVTPSTQWANHPSIDTVPRDARWWCAVHARPLTWDEAHWRPESPGQPRCLWCRDPDVFTRPPAKKKRAARRR